MAPGVFLDGNLPREWYMVNELLKIFPELVVRLGSSMAKSDGLGFWK